MQRDKMIAAKASETEKQAPAAIARQVNRGPSEVLRELVRAEARRLGVWPGPDVGQGAGGRARQRDRGPDPGWEGQGNGEAG